MKITNRRNKVLSLVNERHDMTVHDLASIFNLTPQTMRKDINDLCEIGLLRRLYGGVCLPSSTHNLSLSVRKDLNSYVKQMLSVKVANLIPEGSSVFLGIGSTLEYVARELKNRKDLLVVTNNLNVASILSTAPGVVVKVASGELRGSELDIIGPETGKYFDSYYLDYGIIGVGGLTPKKGLLDFAPEEAQITRAIIRNSRINILVADESKWKRPATSVSGEFKEIDIFVTDKLPKEIKTYIDQYIKTIFME